MTQHLTDQQLTDIDGHLAAYRQHGPTGFACCSAHPVADAVPELLAEVRRLRTENERMRHELEVMYGGAFDNLPSAGGHTDRRDKYATAISRWHRDPEQPLYTQGAEAVMAVADAEQAELRAELERLRSSRWDATKVVADLESRLHATHAVLEGQATPPTDRAALRDRIAAAIYERNNPGYQWADAHPDDRLAYGFDADAVLAVLPEPADRAAVLRWAADHLDRYVGLQSSDAAPEVEGARLVIRELRRMADVGVTPPPALTEEGRLRAQVQVLQQDAERNQGLAKVGARCMREGHQGLIESGHATIEGHRFALSVALGLGTGAPWDAIHERVKELRRLADEQPAAGQGQDGTQQPSPRDQHRAAWHALTPDQQTARLAELDNDQQDGAQP